MKQFSAAFPSPAILVYLQQRSARHQSERELLSVGFFSEAPDLDVFGAAHEAVAALAEREVFAEAGTRFERLPVVSR